MQRSVSEMYHNMQRTDPVVSNKKPTMMCSRKKNYEEGGGGGRGREE